MGNVVRDLRYALRQLARTPGFTGIAILSLALGIGANTAIFSLVNALFLRSLPGNRPAELVSVYTSDYSGPSYSQSSYLDFRDLQDRNQSLSGLIAYTPFPALLTLNNRSERIFGEFVSGNYFDVIQLRPQLGRWFVPEEDRIPAVHPVAVISDQLWERQFARDPEITGKTIKLGGSLFSVVGVAPKGFNGMLRGFASEFWLPLTTRNLLSPDSNDLTNRGDRSLFMLGRLKPGTPLSQARADFDLLAGQLHQANPRIWEDSHQQPRRLSLLPESESRVFPLIRTPILAFVSLLMVVVGLVLLIACSNIANLLLARAAARHKEIAIRLSVGASRGRLLQQLFSESLVLALAAGALGLVMAGWLRTALRAIAPPVPIPLTLDLGLDGKVLLFTLAASLLTAILFGLVPALQSTRTDLVDALKREPAGKGRRRAFLKSGLVVAQLALSSFLLIGSGLFVRSLWNASSIDPGFDPQNLLMMSVDLETQGYRETEGLRFLVAAGNRMKTIPGVQSAGVAELIDLGLSNQRRGTRVEGYTPQQGEDMEIPFNRIGPGFLETMKISLVRGRSFSETDVKGRPEVAIINESFAKKYWPGSDPIGKRLSSDGEHWLEVVGVTRDGKYRTLGEQPTPFLYLPMLQHYQGSATIVMRINGDAPSILKAARSQLALEDAALPVFDIKTGEDHLSFALLPARLAGQLLGFLGVLALLLAIVGIYGVMSFAVAGRTREMGIRIALGASNHSVLRLVIGEGMRLAWIGIAVGIVMAIGLTRFASIFLYGISPTDPLTFAAIALLLSSAAAMACYFPARQAVDADPLVALRSE